MTTRELICRIAAQYGGWPHEVGAFPFHYYRALRDEYLRINRRPSSVTEDLEFDYSAESFKGEAT